jgi:hypothetical protein
MSTPLWLQDVMNGYQSDQTSLDLISKLSINFAAIPNYTLSDGLLRYKGRIWIGCNSTLQQKLLAACHSSALGGHSGVPVTYMRMKKLSLGKR